MRPLLCILLFFPLIAVSQIEPNLWTVDYGVIERGSDRVIDIVFSNSTKTPSHVLRTDFSPEYEILWSEKKLIAEGSNTLRVKYNPRRKGDLKEEYSVWFTTMDEPLIIKFRGKVNYIDNSENTACPDFRSRPSDCCPDDLCQFLVLDAQTKKPIKNSRIRAVRHGAVEKTLSTNSDGEAKAKLPISWYLFVADHENYFPRDTANYVNRRSDFFVIELERRIPLEEDAIVEVIEILEIAESEPELIEEISIHLDIKAPVKKPEEMVDPPVESEELPESLYRENNIVFLVDVSHSMAQYGKLELLQASMLELTGALRGIDQIAFVTYASSPKIMLKSTSGDEKEAIEKIIKELEVGGMTSGAKGFKKAYEIAVSNFNKDGNNEIIVCTDGAFREKDNDPILKMVKKNRRKGITTSVVGIKSNTYASKKLTDISIEGQGSFIPLEEYDISREQLIKEIKKQSRKM